MSINKAGIIGSFSNVGTGGSVQFDTSDMSIQIIGIRDSFRKLKLKPRVAFQNKSSNDVNISYFKMVVLDPGTSGNAPMDTSAGGNVREIFRLDYPFGANAGVTSHYERSPRTNWNGDGNLDDGFEWAGDYTKALNWIKIKNSANGSPQKYSSDGGNSSGGNNTAGPDIEIDIRDITAYWDGITLPIRFLAMGTHDGEIKAQVQLNLNIPQIFQFDSFTRSTDPTTHNSNNLNYLFTFSPTNNNSLLHNIKFIAERVAEDGETLIAGTSAYETYWQTSSNAATARSIIISATKTINFINSNLFPDDEYIAGSEYKFRVTATALDSEGNALSQFSSNVKSVTFDKVVFPILYSKPFGKLSFTTLLPAMAAEANSVNDMYSTLNTSGKIQTGIRYGVLFDSDGFDVAQFFNFDASLIVSLDNAEIQTISVQKTDIGKRNTNNPSELFYFHERGDAYRADNEQYKLTPVYKARNGNIDIISSGTNQEARFTPNCPKHKYPYDSNLFSIYNAVHGYHDYDGSSAQSIKVSIKKNDELVPALSSVNFDSHTEEFSFSAVIQEEVINSIDSNNVGETKTSSNIKTYYKESADINHLFLWNAKLNDEAWYISKLSFNINFTYKAPNTTDYNNWKNIFSTNSISVFDANQEVNFGNFTDDTDGVAFTYKNILQQRGQSFAANYNGVTMNKPGTRISELIPNSMELIKLNDGTLSGHKIRIFYDTDKDPASYPFLNSIPRFAVAVQTSYSNNSFHTKQSNMVVYTEAGQFLGVGDAVNNNTQSNTSKNGLLNNRNKLGSLKNLTSGTENGQHYREFDIELNYEDSKFGYDGGLMIVNSITHNVYFYIEEYIDSVYHEAYDIIFPDLDDLLSKHGLEQMVHFDSIEDAGVGNLSKPANFLHPNGNASYAEWRKLATGTLSKNLSSLLSSFNHITSNNGVPTANSFTASLDVDDIGKINSSLNYNPNSISIQMPFSQSEEIVGFELFAYQGDPSNDIDSIDFIGNFSDWGNLASSETFNYNLTRILNLDHESFDVQEDVNFAIVPKVSTRTSFDGSSSKNSSTLHFQSIGEFSFTMDNGSSILGKLITKNYESEIVPDFSEIEFLEPIDQTSEDADALTEVPSVQVNFKYNNSAFESSKGDYFNSSRENIRIERVIVQAGEEFVPQSEQSKIVDQNIFTLTSQQDGTKKNFTFTDSFNHGSQANDIVATEVDMDKVYYYRYKFFPGFVYNPGGAGEKRIEPDEPLQTFDVVPNNLPLAYGFVENLDSNYNKGHSQEITWDYTYGENLDFLREQGGSIKFDVYYRIKDDSASYQRKKLELMKSKSWIHSGSKDFDITSYTPDNIGEIEKFSHIIKYDEFHYPHRVEVAVLLTIVGGEGIDFSTFNQVVGEHTDGGSNTIGMTTPPATLLEPSDKNKIEKLLTEEEKEIKSFAHSNRNKDFILKNNLKQVPFSITRKKAKPRGNDKPYSSST